MELGEVRRGGSEVPQGNLVTVPLGGRFGSIEPVYVSAAAVGNAGAYPQLKRVFTYFGGQTGYASTLAGSLAELFGSLGQPGAGTGGNRGGTGGHVRPLVLPVPGRADAAFQR